MQLAAYLDEAGDNPREACETLVAAGIQHVAIRNVWTSNIVTASDELCQQLRELLKSYGLRTILVSSHLGECDAAQLLTIPDAQIKRCADLAQYFGAKYVRFSVGDNVTKEQPHVTTWFHRLKTAANGCIPLIEPNCDNHVDLISLVNWLGDVRMVYDPAKYILKRNINPFVRYWTLFKSFVDVIDIRDFKIGHGFKPAGIGDGMLKETLRDALLSEYKGWYVMEPNLGRKYKSAATRREAFELSLGSFHNLLDSLR